MEVVMSNKGKQHDYKFDLLAVCNEDAHIHQDTELIYVLHGTGTVCLESERYQLTGEDIIIINMNRWHSLSLGDEALICRIHIPYALLKRYIDQDYIMFWCNTTLDKNENYYSLRVYLRQMLNCIVTHPDVPNPMTASYFYELLNCLFDHFLVSNGDERFVQSQNKYDNRTNEVIGYIEENYAQHISLNDLAEQLHLTYSYLSRYFKKVFGVNFLEYVNKVRLRHAVEDLLYTDKPITRVAVDNGFVNSSGLNKVFKDTYNSTPTAYKKRCGANLLRRISLMVGS